MKKYFIDALIWYILLSVGVAIIWMLTGLSGFIPLRILMALILSYVKPLPKIKWPSSL